MNAAPGALFETTAEFPTGLAGTLGMTVVDEDGNTITARVTSGIVEHPTITGLYLGTFTAPASEGFYIMVWDDGAGDEAEDELLVSEATGASLGAGTHYVTAAGLKSALNIGSTYADGEINIAVEAASRACDGYKNVGPGLFASTGSQSRVYSADGACVQIDPLNTVTTVKVDMDGDGTFETTWTNNSDFTLMPVNAATDGFPWTEIRLRPQGGKVFPAYLNNVQVTGLFGWAETPGAVAQASLILAGRLLKRARETPYGIVALGVDTVSAARLGRLDPDVAFLLDTLPGSVPLLII